MAKAVEDELQLTASSPEQRRRYDLLMAGLDLLDQAIAVFDASPKLVTWNKALLRLLDFPESLVRVGTPFEAFVRFNAERGEYGEGDIEKLVAARMASARAFEPHYVERVRPNGRVLAVRGVPIPNLGFVSLWTDVTEQRRAEALIQEQNARLEARVRERTAELEKANREIDQIAEALRLSEGRMRLILDAIPAMIAHVDAGRRYRFANRAYAEWFGLTKESIVGRSIVEVFGDDAYAAIEPYLEDAENGERVSYEYARRNAEGRLVHARSAVVPDVSLEGGFRGYFVMSIDITEQKASQAALVQAQKMEAVGQLTGGLAHDFNNLLTIIIGNLSALQGKLAGGEGSEYVDPSLQAARRGAELIRRLLTFSRRQTLEPTAVEVGELVRNMTQLLVRTLGETIAVHLQLPDRPMYALADANQLENALINLAINARDAMPDGGELTITVQPRRVDGALAKLGEVAPGDYVQFDVSDTGKGIEPAVLARVFEPFFTTKPFGGGSGLGLSMVYGFVRQSGGNIRILSTPGKGTSVRFVLPETPPLKQAPVAAGHRDAPAAVLTGPILLVEDEPEVRKVIRMQLTALGHAVLEAGDGVEALALLESVEDIAVLISDTVMPGGLNGRELAQRARALRPALPILLVTGYARELPAGDDAAAGIPVLRKPFDPPALAAALASLTLTDPTTEPSAT
ncbi:PAS-domain containing protein [Thauera sp. 63]|uniref:PAS-domain containing protein n=1 Tax=Thauera sp. 63 TaxID=497321 RepID=UPI0002D0E902|nr:PAS-domain containing protein [Thauera sp. 63]ENO78065.1 PAS/PAC sensor hybrid histidine kinase [Thauera sp. 63]